MPTFRLTLEYDGGGFAGWQLQRGETRTVQGALEAALERVTGRGVRVIGSGFDEGSAEYFASAKERFSGGYAPGALNRTALAALAEKRSNLPALKELFLFSHREFMAQARIHYPLSWLVVHYLQNTKEKRLKRVLGDYFDGEKPVIVVMVYFRCPMLCGLVLNGLIDGLRDLKWTAGEEFEIVAISFDPLERPLLARKKKQNLILNL